MNRQVAEISVSKKVRKVHLITICLQEDQERKAYQVLYKKLGNQTMVCSRCKGNRFLLKVEIVQVLNRKGVALKLNNPTAIKVKRKAIMKLETCSYCRSLN